jgi:hypothetical protein
VTTVVNSFAANARHPQPLAPSASLATMNAPPRPVVVARPDYQPKTRDQALAEILNFGTPTAAKMGSSSSATTTGTPTSPIVETKPPASIVHEPGTEKPTVSEPHPGLAASTVRDGEVASGKPDMTAGMIAAAKPEAAASTPSPKPISTSAPGAAEPSSTSATSPVHAESAATAAPAAAHSTEAQTSSLAANPAPPDQLVGSTTTASDPIRAATRLRAASMSDADQVQVIGLVTQLAAELRSMKLQVAALRHDVGEEQDDTETKVKDFERRLGIAEAKGALASVADADTSEPVTPHVANAAGRVPAPPVAITPVSAAVPDVMSGAKKAYHVQAASPGLAMLSEVDRAGDGAQVSVTVGDSIPGWGKVKSVTQRGTLWVVATEHGVID